MLCVARLLKGFGPKYMKIHEPALVGYLLSALSDDSEEIVKEAVRQLEECGEAIKEMEGERMDVEEQGEEEGQ